MEPAINIQTACLRVSQRAKIHPDPSAVSHVQSLKLFLLGAIISRVSNVEFQTSRLKVSKQFSSILFHSLLFSISVLLSISLLFFIFCPFSILFSCPVSRCRDVQTRRSSIGVDLGNLEMCAQAVGDREIEAT